MTTAVSGTTRLFAVLGDPVHQVQAPALLNSLFVRLAIDAVLVPVEVRPDELEPVVRGLQAIRNLDGLLITVPHKASVCALADSASAAVTLAGSANAMRREPDGTWHADNFDGAGFLAGLIAAGHSPSGRRVTLVGTGGAGSAIAPALLNGGVAALALCDLDATRMNDLAARLEQRWPGRTTCAPTPTLDADIVINATQLGLHPTDPLPFDPAATPDDTLIADIIMKPRETRLLHTAANLGRPIHYGAPMLTEQLNCYRTFFRLAPP